MVRRKLFLVTLMMILMFVCWYYIYIYIYTHIYIYRDTVHTYVPKYVCGKAWVWRVLFR